MFAWGDVQELPFRSRGNHTHGDLNLGDVVGALQRFGNIDRTYYSIASASDFGNVLISIGISPNLPRSIFLLPSLLWSGLAQ